MLSGTDKLDQTRVCSVSIRNVQIQHHLHAVNPRAPLVPFSRLPPKPDVGIELARQNGTPALNPVTDCPCQTRGPLRPVIPGVCASPRKSRAALAFAVEANRFSWPWAIRYPRCYKSRETSCPRWPGGVGAPSITTGTAERSRTATRQGGAWARLISSFLLEDRGGIPGYSLHRRGGVRRRAGDHPMRPAKGP
jgi:hypothetical protein